MCFIFNLFRSIFGPWVKKSSILEVGFEFSMKNCIFPSWKDPEAKNLSPKCKKNKKYDLTLGGYMFGRRIVHPGR